MTRSAAALLGLLLAVAVSGGCAGPMGRAVHALDEARYPDALGEMRKLEPELEDWSRTERLRYALYRGLAHLSLGDARAADRWLSRAKAAHDAGFANFDDRDRGRLLSAWRAMGRMPGERASVELSAAHPANAGAPRARPREAH